MSRATGAEERFGRSIGELGHAVSALQARSRSQEVRLTELAQTRGDVSRRGANDDDGTVVRQLASKLEDQRRAYDERLRALEGRWEVISESADAAAAAATTAAAEAAASAASAASAAAGSHHGSTGRMRLGTSSGMASSSPARGLEEPGRVQGTDGRTHLLEETVASLRSRIDLLEAQQLSELRIGGSARGISRENQEVRNAHSLAENAHKRLSELEGQLSKHQRELAEGVSKLQSEMGMSLKLVRVDAARAEGALEAKLEELSEKLANKAEQVGQSFAAQLSTCENLTERLQGRMPSPHLDREDREFTPRSRARTTDARTVEASVQAATRRALGTMEENLRAVCEQQQNFDVQVTSIMSSVKACGEEQERLSRDVCRRAADHENWLRSAVKSEVSELRCTEEMLSRRFADHDVRLRETLKSELSDFCRVEEGRYRDATLTAEHALAESSQRIRGIGAGLETELSAERGETLRSLATMEARLDSITAERSMGTSAIEMRLKSLSGLEARLDSLTAERSMGIEAIEARLNSLVAERSLGRQEARSIAALEARLEALAAERTSVHAEAASGVATLEVHIDGVATRIAALEARLIHDIEEALCRADEAAAVAQAAEASAQRGEADSRASAARLEAKLETWLESRRDMLRDARGDLRRDAQEVAEAQARSYGARAEDEAELAGRIARRAESAVRQLRENEAEVAGQWMRAEANLSERLMRFSSDEAISAGRTAQRTENALGNLQHQVQELVVMTNQKGTAAESYQVRCDALRSDLTTAIGNLREECCITADRIKVSCDSRCNDLDSRWADLTAAVGDVREECMRRIRELQGASECAVASAASASAAATSTRDETQAVARHEVTTAVGLVRSEVEERLRQLEAKISDAQNMRASEVREHLASIAEQVSLFESRLAPEALARLVRREVELATRDAVQEEFRDQMRSGWFQQADFKFDCTLQCLHVLYLKGGISPNGALATLQRAVRGGGSSHMESSALAGRDLKEETAFDAASGRPPLSPGRPVGSAGLASSAPVGDLLATSAAMFAAGDPSGIGGGSAARLSASPARALSARGPSASGTGSMGGPGVPGGPGGRDAKSVERPGFSQTWARSASLASPRGSSPAATMRRTPRGGSGPAAPPGLASGRPRRHAGDFSLCE